MKGHGMVLCLLLTLLMAPPHVVANTKSKDPMRDPSAIGTRDVGKGLNLYSLEKEIELGRQLAQEVEKSVKLVDDPVITEYVNRVAQNIARHSDAKVPLIAKVIDNDEVNAFALPGGFLFVHTGLIRRAGSEAELAGVIAHEIAHVAARHGTRQASRGQVASWATLPLIFMGGWAGYGVQQAANLGIPLTFLKFSRDFEREADMLAVQYLYAAGYDPLAYVDFFEKIQALEKTRSGVLSDLFRSHPPTDDRIREAQRNIQDMLEPRPQYVVTTSEFAAVLDRLERTLAVRRPAQQDPNKPTLRRKSDSDRPVEAKGDSSDDRDDRPTLRRVG